MMFITSNVRNWTKFHTACLALASLFSTSAAGQPIRIATYNSNYLSACINHVRAEALQQTLDLLKADVIAFQEVRDRNALEKFLPATEWTVVIDDDSTDDQNLAFAVRHGVDYFLLSGETSNAGNEDFLFRSSSNFPDKRDVLALGIRSHFMGEDKELVLLNHHAKSRYGGRVTTEPTRIAAAMEINTWINDNYPDTTIVLGDFNDNPDDASLNTLESGMESPLLVENDPGTFLVNLSEPLLLDDHVSYGLNSRSYITTERILIDHTDTGSRERNATQYSDDINVGKAMYDQILVSSASANVIYQGKAKLFEYFEAVTGNSDTRASDHLPVYVDAFIPPTQIKSVTPNPIGTDNNNETLIIQINDPDWISSGMYLKDASGHAYLMPAFSPGTYVMTITPQDTAFSLNNGGDTIYLYDADDREIDMVQYTSSNEGEAIAF